MITDWLYRLAHSKEVDGFQEYSAQYLGTQLKDYGDALDSAAIELIMSVLIFARQNADPRPQTHLNIA